MPALAEDDLIALAKKYAAQSGVPAALVYAMIMKESSGDPLAQHKRTGARGLMQLKAAAAGEHGVKYDELLDPEKNVQAGAGYIGEMLHRFKDPRRALSAYNAGPGTTRKYDGIAPAAEPYVNEVSGIVRELTQQGQPFAEELDASGALSPEFLHRQKISQTLQALLGPQEETRPPMLPSGEPVTYDDAGISRMLSAFKFNQ